MSPALFAWLARAELSQHPVRMLLAITAIALGLALGFAVHLINASAVAEFGRALGTVNGQADLQVRAVEADFDEKVYALLVNLPDVEVVSPAIEAELAVLGHKPSLKVIGVDVLRAARIQGALMLATTQVKDVTPLDVDAIWLSPAALSAYGKQSGETLVLLVQGQPVTLTIAGTLSAIDSEQRLARMDIAAAQWRLGKLGRLSRIDLKLRQGADLGALRAVLAARLPATMQIVSPADDLQRTDSLSRAYRVNLDMLALMALFTGAFLVYATQSLTVARRRTQMALLRVLGATRRDLLLQVLREGALMGLAGSILGLALGAVLAWTALKILGGDLGGGYFPAGPTSLVWPPLASAVFFLLGLVAALAGSILPAWHATRTQPAVALKAGDEHLDPRATPRVAWALALLIAGAACALLPPVAELPLFAYLSMALLLCGGIGAMPRVARLVLGRAQQRSLAPIALDLAAKHLWGAPGQATVALCGIVASVALMVAMGVMITSFRQSVDDWLTRLLPADLFMRAAGPADSLGFTPVLQQGLATVPGVATIHFQKMVGLRLGSARPTVTLIVRELDATHAAAALPVTTTIERIPHGVVPIWISEAMVDLYQWRLGATVSLPIGQTQAYFVAGVWRDYARQHGAIVMRSVDYENLTGDTLRSEAAITLAPGNDAAAVMARLRAALPTTLAVRTDFVRQADLRALSLSIFDRSFAITYVLQAIAMVIGLLGVGATFSAQTLARVREFGMLRHIGVLRRQIMATLAYEGLLLGTLGVAAGLLLGLVLAQVLIQVVNPQSFHWTMDTTLPWSLMATVAIGLLATTAITAMFAARHVLSVDAVRAVREDW